VAFGAALLGLITSQGVCPPVSKKAPEECPVCNHPQSYFQVKAENY
jgi:hypothetical protein